MENIQWDVGQNGVVVGDDWLCERKGKEEMQKKHDFRNGSQYSFIISRTFARESYSMIV